ncbi:hypothetical protein GR7B_00143 [Vibrio phage vB_VcorM_GR7B]|nr:hypothetical protein GR7B_00143 [Vibrio phage vB_VcorM_GR7B]
MKTMTIGTLVVPASTKVVHQSETKTSKTFAGTYEEYFEYMMEKWGIKSPDELPDAKKDDFFEAVDKGWNSKKESGDDGKVESSVSLEEAALIDNYKKGDRVIVNINTAKNPEYYVATVTKKSPQQNLVYVLFDDGERWQYKATSSQVGILGHASKNKKRATAIKPANLNKWLKGHPDAPSTKKVVGKGTIKRVDPKKAKVGKNKKAPVVPNKKVNTKPQPPKTQIEKDGDKVSVKPQKLKKSKEGVKLTVTKPNPDKVEEYKKTYRRSYKTQLELHMLGKYSPRTDTSKLQKKQQELQQKLNVLERESGDPAACNKARKSIIVYESPKITEKLEEKYATEIKNYTPSWM